MSGIRITARQAIAITIGLATAVLVTPTSAAAPAPAPGGYVSIGDSYTSAPLAGKPAGSVAGCNQTDVNYPRLVAPVLRPSEHVDVSCGGAETKHVFEPQAVTGGANPPQLDAVSAATTVVTIGLGGNDLGFEEIAQHCFGLDPNGSPCKDRFAPDGGADELAARIREIGPRIARVLDAVRAKSRKAKVFLVGYPAAIPDSGKGCSPLVPMSDEDTEYLRDTFQRLNAELAKRAARGNVTYVDTYTPSIEHDFCQPPGVKWVEGVVPSEPASPLHPNARGERGFADALLNTMIGAGAVKYTAIGDSYVAGALTGKPTDAPFPCMQTDGNYPHLVTPALNADLTDVSCSSAKSDDVFEPQQLDDGYSTAPPQLDGVGADTSLVTIGLGANDIELRQALDNCFSPVPYGSPCRNWAFQNGYDELAKRINETGPKMNRVLDAVRAKAPRAKIFVVGYPAVLDDNGQGCWPLVPITPADTVYLRDSMKRLNGMLAQQAKANGVTYVDTYSPGIGRDICQLPGVRWIEPLVPVEPSTPFHPNARGERGFADALLGTMIRG